MAKKLTVRIIRTYEVDVEAEYGDTKEDLVKRGQGAVTTETDYDETVVLLEEEE